MRKILFFTLLLYSVKSYSQISEGGKPFAAGVSDNLKSASQLPVFELKALDKNALLKEDSIYQTPVRYAIIKSVEIDIKKGQSTMLDHENGEMWQYKIEAPGANSIQLIFKKFIIPKGAKLFIYNEQLTQVAGAFTENNMQPDSSFIIADFKGGSLIIEYFEPDNKEFSGQVSLRAIGQSYKNIFQSMADINGYIGINCPEGRNWQYQKHSVCLITFSTGGNSYLCSGALVNDVNSDGKPYFLTANHCISDANTASTLVAYFNDEQAGCDGNAIDYKTLNGASLLTMGPESDYTLLQLSSTPPPDYQPYYAGWDASGKPGSTSTGIHHPEGGTKKICLAYEPPVLYDQTITWDQGATSLANTHWEVRFDAGITNGGSSGSPLFNDKKRIIGQLHGGDSISSYYGMFGYSWTKSASGYKSLKSYLDPGNTNTLAMDGYFPPKNLPDAQFFTDFSQVCLSGPIKFNNISVFNPSQWKWTFTPNNISYQNNTNSLSKNPEISFNNAGTYDVKLVAKNNNGNDSTIIYSMITASNEIKVNLVQGGKIDTCLYKTDSIILVASGAALYNWSMQSNSDKYFYFSKIYADTAIVKIIDPSSIKSSIDLSVKVFGEHGNCSGSSTLVVSLLKQGNDNISNAIQLKIGENGPFNNYCATIQAGEPVPPIISCTGQLSWCDEYMTGKNIVENSVWFTFNPDISGFVTLNSNGMDNEMALYDAASANDVLSGNYTLLAANDDQNDTNPNPALFGVPVKAGKTYWVQVDGSGGGTEGTFTIAVGNITATSVNETNISDILSVYPQPAQSVVAINGNCLKSKTLDMAIFSVTGTLIYNGHFTNNADTSVKINTENWVSGLYLLRVVSDGNLYLSKILKK